MTTIRFKQRIFYFSDRDEADRSVISEIFSWREYRAVEGLIAAAATIVDVGAHIGIWSAYASSLNPLAKIYALEPEADNFRGLRQTVSANHLSQVKIFPIALAAASGRRRLAVAADSINHRLLPPADQSEGPLVAARSLADFCQEAKIGSIDVLKLDIEGGEYELIGAWQEEDFARMRSLILEYHLLGERTVSELEGNLRRHGFSVQIFPSRFDKDLGFLLARNKKVSGRQD